MCSSVLVPIVVSGQFVRLLKNIAILTDNSKHYNNRSKKTKRKLVVYKAT